MEIEDDLCDFSEERNSPTKFNIVRILFFVINFIFAIGLLYGCVFNLIEPDSPHEFLGAIVLFIPVVVYGVCEWLAFYRQKKRIEQNLGLINLGCAGWTGLVSVTSVGEYLMEDAPIDYQTIFEVLLISGLITTYLAACGWSRYRWNR